MELHQIECFVRTAELGSFTKAAGLLHISQPALSKNISLLEGSLGVKLFDRQGKRFSLSPIGSQVLEHAQRILDHREQIELLCQAEQPSQHPVTIRMMCASELFSDIMAGFRALHPDVQVTLLPNVKTTQQEESDVLVFSSRQRHDYRTDQSVLCEELRMLVPPGHPLYDHERLSMDEIVKYPILSLRPQTDLRSTEDYYYELAGISPHRDVECDNPAILRTLLQMGFGMAMVPVRTWDVTAGTENKLLPIQDFRCIRYINVHLPSPKQADRNVQALFDYFVQFFSERNQDPTE